MVLRHGNRGIELGEREQMIRSLWSELRDMDDEALRSWLLRAPGVVIDYRWREAEDAGALASSPIE